MLSEAKILLVDFEKVALMGRDSSREREKGFPSSVLWT